MPSCSVHCLSSSASVFYFLPHHRRVSRKVVNIGSVFAVNLLLGLVTHRLGRRPGHGIADPPSLGVSTASPGSRTRSTTGVVSGPEGTGSLRWWDGGRWTQAQR